MNLSFIGDLTVDIYPKLKKILLGGSSLTSARWAKKLGAECTILASVGNDEAGKRYQKFFKDNNFSLNTLITLNAPTSNIEIFIDKNGEHTFGEWEPGAYAEYHLSKSDFAFLKTQDAVCLPVYFKTRHLLDEIIKINTTNDQKPLIAIDFDDLSQFGKNQKIIEDHLPYIDIVKLGLDIDIDRELIAEIKHLAVSTFSPNNPNPPNPPKLFLVTLNKNGSVVFCQGKEFWQKADNIKVKNTTGAGDAYIAGFLVEYLKSGDIKKSMKQGTNTATLAISKPV